VPAYVDDHVADGDVDRRHTVTRLVAQRICAVLALGAIVVGDAILVSRLTPITWRCELESRTRGSRPGSTTCTALIDALARAPMLYEAAIDTVYSPGVRHPVWAENARVLLAAQTESVNDVLTQPGVQRELRRVLGESHYRELTNRFEVVNAQPTPLARYLQPSARWIILDSSEVHRRLSQQDSVVSNQLGVDPDGRLPGILAFSAPAISRDGSTALLYANLRSPRADQGAHVLADALLVLTHDGTRWRVKDEIPVAGGASRQR
jgi:hypothetical protein